MENNDFREFGNFRLCAEQKVLWYRDEPVHLHLKQIEVLCVLTEDAGKVIKKEELLNRVWAESFVEESNLSRHIYKLRKAFEEHGESPDLIQTVPRRGYRFTGEIGGRNSDDVIIERHSLTKTLIEQIEDTEEPKLVKLNNLVARARLDHIFAFLTICLVATGVLIGVYLYSIQNTNSAPSSSIKTLAVLPLRSIGQDDQNTALNLGFADALITRLSDIGELKLVSANAVSRFVEENLEPIEVGKKLGVDAVLAGTLQHANGELRITLRLLRISDGVQIWSKSFDDSESEIFRLQDSMALQTASALHFNLTNKDGAGRPTENLEAYNLFLQGQYLFRRRETGKSIEFFKKATELDPQFAKAWSGLAAAYAMGDSMPEAESTIEKAIELQPQLGEAHAVRGFVKMFLKWDWPAAEESLNRAVELDPYSVEAHHWRGIYLLICGRLSESQSEIERALELDPTSANLINDYGQMFYFAREFEKAELQYQKARSMDDKIAPERLIQLFKLQGRNEEALTLTLLTACPQNTLSEKFDCEKPFRDIYSLSGAEGISREFLKNYLAAAESGKLEKKRIASTWTGAATYYLELGNISKAVECLEKAMESKQSFEIMNFTFPFIAADPQFDALKNDPNFQVVVRLINL